MDNKLKNNKEISNVKIGTFKKSLTQDFKNLKCLFVQSKNFIQQKIVSTPKNTSNFNKISKINSSTEGSTNNSIEIETTSNKLNSSKPKITIDEDEDNHKHHNIKIEEDEYEEDEINEEEIITENNKNIKLQTTTEINSTSLSNPIIKEEVKSKIINNKENKRVYEKGEEIIINNLLIFPICKITKKGLFSSVFSTSEFITEHKFCFIEGNIMYYLVDTVIQNKNEINKKIDSIFPLQNLYRILVYVSIIYYYLIRKKR